jgi:hypothetical protein
MFDRNRKGDVTQVGLTTGNLSTRMNNEEMKPARSEQYYWDVVIFLVLEIPLLAEKDTEVRL